MTAVDIKVNAMDPDGDKLQFNCEVLIGRLSECPQIVLSTSGLSKNETQVTTMLKLRQGESIGKTSLRWKLSAKILRGEGTSTIVIDTTGVDDEAVKVEVTVDGLDPACSNTATDRLLIKRN